jgi:hypothetical protein
MEEGRELARAAAIVSVIRVLVGFRLDRLP